jgi:hypothetical protein
MERLGLKLLIAIMLVAVRASLVSAQSSGAPAAPTQPNSAAEARTLSDRAGERVSVRDFGAVCNDSNDDTAAIQAAIDALGDTSLAVRSGSRLLIPGPCVISRTITIRRKSFILEGQGWGYRQDSNPRRSYIRWNGNAGLPMIRIQDVIGGLVLRDLKLLGKTTARPSAAIEFNETNDGIPNHSISLENVKIGAISGETDAGTQFGNGIAWAGIGANNSEIRLIGLDIQGCQGYGIRQSSVQNVNVSARDVSIGQCATGIRVTGKFDGATLNLSQNGVDFELPPRDDDGHHCNSQVLVNGYFSELAGRLAVLKGGRLIINGGQYQLNKTTNTDGKVVDATGSVAADLTLRDFRFFPAGTPSTPPFLDFSNLGASAGSKSIVLDGIIGWSALTGGKNGMDVTTGAATDRRYVYFREEQFGSGGGQPLVAQNMIYGVRGAQWDISRFDLPSITYTALSLNITGDQNNFDSSRATVWRLSSDAPREITGIAGGWSGRVLKIINVGEKKIILRNQHAGSTPANRIITRTDGDVVLDADGVLEMIYDSVSSRWRITSVR